MSKAPIRVLVVDDSAVIRKLICDKIEAEPDMEVAGIGRNGGDAIEKVESLKPDVVTLDVQMPGTSGVEALPKILKRRPVPVIMFSTLTKRAADVTLDCLERGAMDYLAKPEDRRETEQVLGRELLSKIRAVAGADVERVLRIRNSRQQASNKVDDTTIVQPAGVKDVPEFFNTCVVIGISTGGPPALATLFQALRPPMPAIVIVQHMPQDFTAHFAARLDRVSPLSVSEAATGDELRQNHAYVARGGAHLELNRVGSVVKTVVRDGASVCGHKPSVDVAMESAAKIFRDRCLGVIMTGMGYDGAAGCAAIQEAGGYVLGQDGETSDVYGMNKVAFEKGFVNRQFSLPNAAATVMTQCRRLWTEQHAGAAN